jgi:hypothetical protein
MVISGGIMKRTGYQDTPLLLRFCCKFLTESQQSLSPDTVMLRAQQTAEMRIGPLLKRLFVEKGG